MLMYHHAYFDSRCGKSNKRSNFFVFRGQSVRNCINKRQMYFLMIITTIKCRTQGKYCNF